MKRALLAAALMVAVAGCGSKGSAGGGSTAESLVIGASFSQTGALAREGGLTKEGYEYCKDTINAKGGVDVGGKKLKLDIQYQDDASTPDTAARIIYQFNDKGVKLILGPYGSANTAATAPVVERNGQVMADSAGAADDIFAKGYKRTFAVLSPASEYIAAMIKAVDELAVPKPKTIAFLSADDSFSKIAAEAGAAKAKELGYTVLPIEYFPAQSSDVSASLTKVKAAKPDLVIGSVHLVEGIAIVKQAAELGVAPKGFGEIVAPATADFKKTLGPLSEGVLGSSQWTITTQGKDDYFGTAKDYAAGIQAKYGHPAQYHNAEASAACMSLAMAANKAGSTDPNKVRDALAALDTESFFGKIKFNEKGQNTFKPMSVIQLQQGKVVTVWPTAGAEAKLIWPAAK